MSVLRPILFAGVVLAASSSAHAEPALPPIVPHANMPGRYVCDKTFHLYERGGTYFCARDPALWPNRVGYVVLDTKAADTPLVAAAIAEARRLTGAEIVPDSKPDLVIVVMHERLDGPRLEALAAKAGVKLKDDDIHVLTFETDRDVKPNQYFNGGAWGPSPGSQPHHVAWFDGRAGAKTANADKLRDATRDHLREDVLAYFSIKEPKSEIIDACTLDPETEALAADKTHVDPAVLADGAAGLRCAENRVLLRQGGETFCATMPEHWPRTITYATIGPAAGAHADDIAAAVAHVERLSGRKLVAGRRPSVVLALIDRPLDDAQIDAALTLGHIAAPNGSMSASIMSDLRSLRKDLAKVVKAAEPKASSPTAHAWGQSCFAIELEEAIRTDRPTADVRKDIDEAFLKVFQIEAPKRTAPAGAKQL